MQRFLWPGSQLPLNGWARNCLGTAAPGRMRPIPPSRRRPHARPVPPRPPRRGRGAGRHRPAAAAPRVPAAVERPADCLAGQPAHRGGRRLPDLPAHRLDRHGGPGQPERAGAAAGRVGAGRPGGGRLGPAQGPARHPGAARGRRRRAGRQRDARAAAAVADVRLHRRGRRVPERGLGGAARVAAPAGAPGRARRRAVASVGRVPGDPGHRPRRRRPAHRPRRVRAGLLAERHLVRGGVHRRGPAAGAQAAGRGGSRPGWLPSSAGSGSCGRAGPWPGRSSSTWARWCSGCRGRCSRRWR
jgi:hypothetical protein